MKSLAIPTAFLILVSLVVTPLAAQTKQWPSDFECQGRVLDARGAAVPRAEVALLKVGSRSKQWTLIDRSQCDEKGEFLMRCPLGVSQLGVSELRLLVLPTETTAAQIHDYHAPPGFDEYQENRDNTYRTDKRKSLEVTVTDMAGKPVPGAEVKFGHLGDLSRMFPELKLVPGDDSGKITVDWAGGTFTRNLLVWHPEYAPWELNSHDGQKINWNDATIKMNVTLVKGDRVTIQWDDLRATGRGLPFDFSVNQLGLQATDATFTLHVDRAQSPPTIHWRATGNIMLENVTLSNDRLEHTIRLLEPQTVHGFLRDKLTNVPLPGREIVVHSADTTFASSTTQPDGYFQVTIPKTDADPKLTVSPDSWYAKLPEPQILPRTSLARPISLFDSLDQTRQLVIKTDEAANRIVYAIESTHPMVVGRGTARTFEYDEGRYDGHGLHGYALNAPLYGVSKAADGVGPKVATANQPIRREIELKPTTALRGRLVNRQGNPLARYSLAVLRDQGNPLTVWTSSHGRFATSLVPPSQPLTLAVETNRYSVIQSADLGEIVCLGSHLESLPNQGPKRQRSFVVQSRQLVKRVPSLDYHVDRWIHGEPVPIDRLNRKLPVLVVHGSTLPVSALQLISYAFPKDKLTIIAIHYPNSEDPQATEALQTELSLRGCAFSVGIDDAAKTSGALSQQPLLFNLPSDEVFMVPDLLAPVRDIMLHMRTQP
ncbi:MAG: hypothetical protein IT423_08650 [Pirellulaceae bacterium]|nr:hypothetical protein [Pirellulaceae bacterium]